MWVFSVSQFLQGWGLVKLNLKQQHICRSIHVIHGIHFNSNPIWNAGLLKIFLYNQPFDWFLSPCFIFCSFCVWCTFGQHQSQAQKNVALCAYSVYVCIFFLHLCLSLIWQLLWFHLAYNQTMVKNKIDQELHIYVVL